MLSKKEHLKKIVEEENLDRPKDSVEFLQYVKKHQKKVDTHRRRVHSMSKGLMLLGFAGMAFMAYNWWTRPVHHEKHYSGKNHRLGASAEVEDDGTGMIFKSMSLAIWGLIVSKAKSGLEAASQSEEKSVGATVKKIGALCGLIVAASLFQLMAQQNTSNPVEAVSAATKATSSKKLQASNESEHLPSYYDKSSSHYMGGAHNQFLNAMKQHKETGKPLKQASRSYENHGHNILVQAAQETMKQPGVPKVNTIPSQKSMGGSHNVAMAVLTEQSRQFKQKRAAQQAQVNSQSMFSAFLNSASTRQVSDKQYQKNLQNTGAFVAFIATLAVCISYFVTVKTYHAQVKKMDQLKALLKNPNARVASGKKGKEIVKKLTAKKEIPQIDEEAPAPKSDTLESLIKAAKVKKALAKVEESQSELLLSGYQAPKIEVQAPKVVEVVAAPAPAQPQIHYQLCEPAYQVPKPVVMQNAYPMLYPQNFEVQAPLPMPQVSKVAINQPEPMREPQPAKQPNLADIPKEQLIKALLAQMAKE